MLHQTFLFLGQLWQLFDVSQILEFLRYTKGTNSDKLWIKSIPETAVEISISLLMGTVLQYQYSKWMLWKKDKQRMLHFYNYFLQWHFTAVFHTVCYSAYKRFASMDTLKWHACQ